MSPDGRFLSEKEPPELVDQLFEARLRFLRVHPDSGLWVTRDKLTLRAFFTGPKDLQGRPRGTTFIENPCRCWVSPFSGRAILHSWATILTLSELEHARVIHRRGHFMLIAAKGKPVLWAWILDVSPREP